MEKGRFRFVFLFYIHFAFLFSSIIYRDLHQHYRNIQICELRVLHHLRSGILELSAILGLSATQEFSPGNAPSTEILH